MRSYLASIAATILFMLLARSAVSQDDGNTSTPIAVGNSIKITVVEGNRLHFEYNGKIAAVQEGVATIATANKTAVINGRWPYLCYLPIVGQRFFTYTERRPMQHVPKEIRVEIAK